MAILGKRKRGGRSTAGQGLKKRRMLKSSAKFTNNVRDTHYFTRWSATTDVVGNAAYAPWTQAHTYTLAGLPASSEFSNLFDRYKITYVKHYFTLTVDPGAQAAGSAFIPTLFYVRDYDDSTPIATMNDMRQHSKARRVVMRPGKVISIGIKPATLAETYRSAVQTTYSPQWGQWIDMATTDCPYFGLKTMIDNLTNTNYIVKHEVRMWFACKDTR